MNPIQIIERYYDKNSLAYKILTTHSHQVTQKALQIAARIKKLKPNIQFIEEAGMLHDIGIFLTYAPNIGCHGEKPYICHGYLGRNLLEKENFPKHALVCERHTGCGIMKSEIEKVSLPLPHRDMFPCSLEEKIICFADKFFSKNPRFFEKEKSPSEILKNLAKYGERQVNQFGQWCVLFKENIGCQ